ncbi:MAG: TrkH family potassium uptake protein, partial [Longimicrobiales bacterium]
LLLWALWQDDLGALGALWPAIFHAISAFCNAGFSIFTQNFIRFAADPASTVVVAALVVVGGIGFLVLEECVLRVRGEHARRLSLHSRLVLVSTAALILVGWTLFTAFEWNNALTVFAPSMRPLAALFMSITPRTAGFNNVDYSQLSSASLFLTVLLMIIGGSPGSTAGGIKTTSTAVLVALAVAKLRGRQYADVFGRMIPEDTIQKTVGLVVFSVVILAGAVLLLQVTELRGVPYDLSQGLFLELAFEAVSAFDTVGLSMGMTDDLSSAGKGVIIALMFIGRVGPFTVVASMARAGRLGPVHIRYASEDVVVG